MTNNADPAPRTAPSVEIVVPIYKPALAELEQFSVEHSLAALSGHSATFVHPKDLDTGYYRERFPKATWLPLPAVFFESHRNYNQLCYEVGFYSQFLHVSHMLLLQPDALVVSDDLARWCGSRYDYIGGPECNEYSYDLRGIAPFTALPFLAPVRLSGCNGGLSLRRVSAFIAVLQEYPALTDFFRHYGVGIGEDIFFSLLGRVSECFQVANEFAAAKFAITDRFAAWMEFNEGVLPFGFHGWFKKDADRVFILDLLSRTSGDASRFSPPLEVCA